MRRELLASAKKRKKKKIIFKAVLFFAAFSVLFSASTAFFYIPFFKIKKISIKGNETIPSEKIIKSVWSGLNGKYLKIFPRNNVFLMPKNEISKKLAEEIPRIKNLKISRNFFGGMSVSVLERKDAALACVLQNCATVDEDGFVFEKSPFLSGGLALKIFDQRNSKEESEDKSSSPTIMENILPPEQFKKLLEFSGLILKLNNEVIKIDLKKEETYEFYTKEGWRVLINARNEPDRTFANLKTSLDSEIKENRKNLDYIDLRFGNKVYFKYK